jgi:hypothetical protein
VASIQLANTVQKTKRKVDCCLSVEVIMFGVVTRQKSGEYWGVAALKMVVAEFLEFSESYSKRANDIRENNGLIAIPK